MVLLLWLLKLFEWKAEDSGERKSGDLGFGSLFNAIFSSWCSEIEFLLLHLTWRRTPFSLNYLYYRINTVLIFCIYCVPRMVGLRSELFWSDFSAGLLPLEVSVEAPEESGFSDTHSETAPSTLATMIKHTS